MNKKSSGAEAPLSTRTIVMAATALAILAALFFLLFSVSVPGEGRPAWYGITTYVLEEVAFLGASILCLRNWRSSQIVSGRAVWLLLGLGMLSYFVGNLLFGYWELGLQQEPDISPGDFFFILAYILIGCGMLLAVVSRRLNLSPVQWLIAFGIGALGTAVAFTPFLFAPEEPAAAIEASAAEPTAPAPVWALALQEQLAPLADIVSVLYIVGDIILVFMATTLLLAFWGGRFSQPWRFIALAAFSFYIADLWFSYATTYIADYQTGALPEVFWVFSGVLVAIGAALEYDLSTRSRRSGRRRS